MNRKKFNIRDIAAVIPGIMLLGGLIKSLAEFFAMCYEKSYLGYFGIDKQLAVSANPYVERSIMLTLVVFFVLCVYLWLSFADIHKRPKFCLAIFYGIFLFVLTFACWFCHFLLVGDNWTLFQLIFAQQRSLITKFFVLIVVVFVVTYLILYAMAKFIMPSGVKFISWVERKYPRLYNWLFKCPDKQNKNKANIVLDATILICIYVAMGIIMLYTFFAPNGREAAESIHEFCVIDEGETKYAVVYNNGNYAVLEQIKFENKHIWPYKDQLPVVTNEKTKGLEIYYGLQKIIATKDLGTFKSIRFICPPLVIKEPEEANTVKNNSKSQPATKVKKGRD